MGPRSRGRAAAAALVLGLLAPLGQANACPDPDEEPLVLLYADTLTVTFHTPRRTYRPGETAKITVTVERHAPAGVTERIAADVTGRLRAANGVEPKRFAFTLPERGTATHAWRIPKGTRPGRLSIDATALYELVLDPGNCSSSLAYERGKARTDRFITITR